MAAPVSSSSEFPNDGPVLNLINKRLRALRKKLNRIAQMEESLTQGKTLNKEQEETFRSKSSVLAAIDELEKLRQPIAQAVGQEIELSMEKKTDEKPESEAPSEEVVKKAENDGGSDIPDLLKLIYFGSIFDVRTLMSAQDQLLTRTHERSCCLTYDYVTDDDSAGDPLKELDLDLISSLGGLLISRPVNSSLSHQNALEKCVEHAKLWLENSEQPIEPNSSISYASLREKLDKIIASEYFTTTPEIKGPVEVVAAAGNYTSYQMPVYGTHDPSANVNAPVEGSVTEYQQEENVSPNSHGSEVYDDEQPGLVEEHQQGGADVENVSEHHTQTEQGIPETEGDKNSRDMDSKDQQHPRRSYQNYRGGRGGGGGRRGYANGRGGRGGNRGGYQNGRGQFYDQAGGYYPRNNNYRGRGGRGMGGNQSYREPAGHAASQAQAA